MPSILCCDLRSKASVKRNSRTFPSEYLLNIYILCAFRLPEKPSGIHHIIIQCAAVRGKNRIDVSFIFLQNKLLTVQLPSFTFKRTYQNKFKDISQHHMLTAKSLRQQRRWNRGSQAEVSA